MSTTYKNNTLKLNTIINGNSIDEMEKLQPESVDLIFADPPYFMRTDGKLKRIEGTTFSGCVDAWDKFDSSESYEEFTEKWLSACYRILKPNGSIWVIGGMQCIYTIGAIMQKLGFWFINDVIWQKTNPTPNFMGTRINNSHETLIWATKSQKSKFTFNYKTAKELNTDYLSEEDFNKGVRKQMGSVWRFPVCKGSERLKDDNGEKLHNTQKPLELLKRIIAISSKKGDVVLDPFGGTMTTGVAAKMLGRNYIMIEREKKYCKYGEKRLKETTYEDTPVANAVYDEKPVRVSMSEMIEAGFFKVGEDFCFKDGKPVTKLCENGKLKYKGEVIDMHSCCAIAKNVKAKKLNGYNYWYVLRDGKAVSISEIREEYRKKVS